MQTHKYGVGETVYFTSGMIGRANGSGSYKVVRLLPPDGAEFLRDVVAANADWKSQPGYGVILANQPGDQSWPMTAATWILLYKKPADPAAVTEALKFFAWAYAKGGKMAEDLDYVPMPANVVGDVQKMWSVDIKDAGGKPLFSPAN